MAGWLRRLLGGGAPPRAAAPAPVDRPPREPLVFPEGGDNPVHLWLDAAGVPWRSSREELTARYGVTDDPGYGWEVIQISGTGGVLDGLMGPLSTMVQSVFSPRLPATDFTGVTWFGDDARENLRRTAVQLEPALGPARIEEEHNIIRCDWRFGLASVSLIAWPPDLQSGDPGSNPAQEAEPKLVTACQLMIATGLRPAASEREQVWLASFIPFAPIQAEQYGDSVDPRETPANQSELEFVREPPVDLAPLLGFVGRSADGEALIFCHRQLYVVPTADIAGFHVHRLLPAKGGGGAWLEVECRTDYGDREPKRLPISAAPGADDLNALAETLAAAMGKPLVLGEYYHDA